jgi:amino acid adenylation domain-containing protein
MHHAILDDWSRDRFLHMVEDEYHEIKHKDERQMIGMNEWVNYLQKQDITAAEKFWQTKLQHTPEHGFPVLPDAQYSPLSNAHMRWKMPVNQQYRQTGITSASVVRAAWALVVAQESKSPNAVFAVTSNGRAMPFPGVELVDGPTVLTTPVLITVRPDESLSSLLKRVQRQTAESMPFDHLGMHRISKLSLACQRATRCQSILVIQTAEDPLLNSDLFTPDHAAKLTPMTYALTLKVRLGHDSIEVLAQYDDRVLTIAEVHRLLSRWESLMQARNATITDIIGLKVGVIDKATRSSVVPSMSQTEAQQKDAQAYWGQLFAGTLPAKFPLLTDAHYRPLSTGELRISIPIDYGYAVGDISLTTVLRGVWGLLMSQYSSSLDVIFGMMLQGQTVPVRLQLDEGKQSLLQFFDRVQNEAKSMEPFMHLGLQNISALSDQAAAASQFQSILAIMDDDRDTGEDGLNGSLAQYALALVIRPRTQHFEICARFDPHVLTHTQTRRLLGQYTHGLQQCWNAQWKQMAVQDITWTGSEDIQAIQSWNAKQAREPMAQSIPRKFDEVTGLYRDMTAIDSWDGTFTYARLDQYSTSLAHVLVEKGVKSETVVAICLHKSKWAVVAMMAALKAGATVIFLDPSHPTIRLQAILDLTHAHLILASPHTRQKFRHGDIPVMDVIDSVADPASANSRCLPDVSPSNAAFIVSTSGTTGKPKAIVLEHGAVCVSALSVAQTAGITPGIRFFQFANYTFDVSYGDMLGTLLYGGCLCIPSEDERMGDLAGAIVRSRASVITLTPTVATLLRPSEVPELRTMILAGEAITSSLIESWANQVNLIVLYGPAEATIYSTGQAHLSRTDPSGIIGRALGCTTWVLDVTHRDACVLAPVGAVGELAIEGSIVSRGYLEAPVETQASFVSAVNLMPGAPTSQHRLYRTGDLVRYLEDGRLQFIGRRDQQVKFYGQRIAPEAIECEIQRLLPAKVQTAVLVVVPKDHDQPLLVATIYIEPEQPDHGSLRVLRGSQAPKELATLIPGMADQLRATLPSHMVPSVFLPISHLPLTGSGKMDYTTLRTCCQDLKRGELMAVWPPTPPRQSDAIPEQRLLATAWAEVLGCDEETLDANSDFVKLGGNSLHAILLVTAMGIRGFRLSVKQIFAHPQLASMASLVTKRDAKKDRIKPKVIKPLSMCPIDIETVRKALEEQSGKPAGIIEDVYPCSPLQAGLMALSLTEPRSYLAQFTYKPPIGTSITQFCAAWETVFQRSPMLRTHIVLLEEMLQVVVKDQISWQIIDDLDQYLAADLDSPTGLGQPLVRFALKGDAVVFTIHHALYDGWSLAALLDDVSKVSRGLDANPRIPYNVFIHHLRAMDRAAAIKFWSERLEKAPAPAFPVLPSPGYRPYADKRYELTTKLPPRESSHITQATVFRTAWALVMARYASMTDVVFGSTLSGRTLPIRGIENIDGPTIATVPVRVTFKTDQTVHSLLEAVQQDRIETIPFEQLGLQNIKKVSETARQACDFQSMLVIQNYNPANESSEASEASSLELQRARVHLSHLLTVDVTPMGSEVEFLARFDGEVLDMQQVRRLLYQTHHVIVQLWNVDPRATVKDIEILCPEDRQDIVRWNDYPVDAIESDLPTLIAQRTSTQPTSPAVRAWDGELTYRELHQLSANLAGHLRDLGVRKGQPIPLCFEKSAWTVVAMLGILKVGATVVPLDANHPVGRIVTIVQAVKASLMVASALQAPRFQDQDWDMVTLSPATIQAFESPVEPLPAISPSDVALIMFTSGSTGVPKGILMDHGCLCSSIITHSYILSIPPHINVLQYSAYTFDHSIFEIYTTLVTGGCVCVLSDDERMNSLVDSMRRMEIDWVYFTPSIAKLIHVDDVPTLSTLYVGGEPVPRSLIDEWATAKTMINAYGPAECSMVSSCVLAPTSPVGTIGRPQAGRTWIVEPDDYNRLAPVGVMGEMVYEGPMVARGYLNDTPSSGFINRPKWASPDTPFRFYRTGDLGRYESDGSLVFGGRKDTQIKLRGQRVEPGEVESQIQKLLPDIALAVEVVVAADGDGTPSLAAFLVVVDDDSGVSQEPMDLIDVSQEAKRRISSLIAGLEEALLRTLPEYMVPTVYLPLRMLPLTTSGKVDRKILRQLGKQLTVARLAALTTVAEYSPPLTDAEVTLQDLWSAVLNIDKTTISAENSFLRLGGDSITAIRLVRATREAGFRLDVEQVFHYPILHEMASNMRPLNLDDERSAPPVAPFSLLSGPIDTLVRQVALQCNVEPSSIEDIYPCTAMQSGLMFLSAREPGTYIAQTTYCLNQPFSKFRAAWLALVALTPLLRTCIVQHESDHLQVVLKDAPAINTVQKIDASFLETERQQLTKGRVLSRLALCESPDGTTRAVFTLHHAVYDGWSQALLIDRLQNLLKGRPIAPSPSFTRFISHIQTASASDEEFFWKTQLADAVPVSFPQLPALGYRPKPMTVLDYHIVQKRILASDFTESTRIRAAWALLVSRYLDQRHVTIGVTVNGRGASVPGIDRILGPMLTTVPVTIDTSRTTQVSEYLSAIQRQAVEMQAYEQYGLQHIAAINDKIRAVCDFHSLLVIHYKGWSAPGDQAQPFWIPERDCIKRPFHAFALSMECTVQRDGVAVHATYDDGVIDPRAMKRIVYQFEHILQQLGTPDVLSSALDDIELISPADQAELAVWNAVVPAPTMACIHHLVEDQIKQRPEAPAVASWEGGFTFRQLDTFASSLAEHLRETSDIGPGVLVPLLFEKSIYTVVTMLAVLKAGGACAALDPAHPTERLRGILEDVQATIVLASTSNLAKAVELRLPVIAVDQVLLDNLVTTPLKLPPSTVGPEDPAIILFTSGSTGKPKGIVIDHRAFASSIRGHSETLRYRAGSRNLQFTAYTSDVSYGEIFSSLSAGACVCIPSEDERVNDLAGAMERLRVDWAFLTPSVASILDPQTVPTLRTLVFGGETATAENIQTWADAVYLINSFGPAECSIWNCCNPGISTRDIGSNIGKGLGCAQWIVDPNDDTRLAPIGTVGELVVEGPNVAKGYLHLPEKTKAVFIPSPPWVPESRRSTSRLYKTGDLATFMPDGNVQFLGRRDAQVKLHGQRLELGEVEHQLRQYLPSNLPEVAAEMVCPAGGAQLLAAFVNIRPVLTDESTGDSDLAMSDAAIDWLGRHFPGLEDALAERLPRFMIPSLIVPLTRMPLSGSAKTDRGRLRQIVREMTREQIARLHACRITRRIAPTTDRERRLHSCGPRYWIWNRQVLADQISSFISGVTLSALYYLLL